MDQQRVLWREERERFLAALNSFPHHLERNRAAMLLLYDTGCRVSELVALDRNDYDHQRKTVLVINSKAKGHPRREIPIHYRTARALRAYLRTRQDDDPAMFVSQKGGRLAIRTVSMIYAQACEIAGIEGKGVHTLRHTAATRLLDDRVLPVHQLSRRLGHRSIQTTYRYYVHGSTEEEAQAIRNSRL